VNPPVNGREASQHTSKTDALAYARDGRPQKTQKKRAEIISNFGWTSSQRKFERTSNTGAALKRQTKLNRTP